MEDRTQARVQQIAKRTALRRRHLDARVATATGAIGVLMLMGIAALLQGVHAPGVVIARGAAGSLLLQDGADLYVVVGIAAFVAGVALTLAGIRARARRKVSPGEFASTPDGRDGGTPWPE